MISPTSSSSAIAQAYAVQSTPPSPPQQKTEQQAPQDSVHLSKAALAALSGADADGD